MFCKRLLPMALRMSVRSTLFAQQTIAGRLAPFPADEAAFHRLASPLFAKKASKEKKGKSSPSMSRPKISLTDEEMAAVVPVDELRHDLQGVVDVLKKELIGALNVRSGSGLEVLEVEMDGEVFPLKELASIAKKGPNLVALNLASLPDAIKPVLEAITRSGMNLNPQQEGTMIYVPLPKVTREHRESLAKNAKMLFNRAKEDIHKVRNAYDKVAKKQKDSGASEDLVFNVCENISFLAEKSVADCESLLIAKTKELLGDN